MKSGSYADCVEILAKIKGEWMLPSPVNEGQPRPPRPLPHRFQNILKRAKCKKRILRNVYAKTREECEEKLTELIKTKSLR